MAFGAAVKYNNTLLELNLEYNGLADDGTVALADALEQNASIRRLRAGHNNARIRGSFVMGLAVLHREAKLDFLGFGLPSSAPSLGELTLQAKQNLQAPWLGITAFLVFALLLALLVFIFEGVRDAFDPRKTFS